MLLLVVVTVDDVPQQKVEHHEQLLKNDRVLTIAYALTLHPFLQLRRLMILGELGLGVIQTCWQTEKFQEADQGDQQLLERQPFDQLEIVVLDLVKCYWMKEVAFLAFVQVLDNLEHQLLALPELLPLVAIGKELQESPDLLLPTVDELMDRLLMRELHIAFQFLVFEPLVVQMPFLLNVAFLPQDAAVVQVDLQEGMLLQVEYEKVELQGKESAGRQIRVLVVAQMGTF